MVGGARMVNSRPGVPASVVGDVREQAQWGHDEEFYAEHHERSGLKHARLRFTYSFDARMTEYITTASSVRPVMPSALASPSMSLPLARRSSMR